ncbi:asparagine synthase (glutamine-hydrolyzing) [Poseidonibacter lekithochrous]|uniref:asparagine synthase (glutamine-hydrolyzing) n=1 Tax=Poseidonibacter TaxID=2321187 RepID=UPI001C09F7FC|nr:MULTISPECIES: asparagine synthase (glutamine-hydrolyzing) [Poseidonibacter]MBU3015745.1 asparagine synthase (glutamine-hydrolyzing) [Poseidonibacter lekithochrous]MDO6829045.1 asparagine synthase (glutamine-hydrolyzing) [Poseidonibacter sp. 1_MG-2023]
MCGIIGIVDYSKNIKENSFNKMRDIINYRGPDDFGTEIFEKDNFTIGLGHRRLSIQDLSPLGHQPMSFENLSIIFNGEVYNFEEIKEELLKLNYTFVSHSDTEIILKAFDAWGIKCVNRFRGMFAFCIYDKNDEKLYIFRDRAGVKPLYYHINQTEFIFGSELKSFYVHENFKKSIEKKALPFYFRFGYIPAPFTIFENTFKLKPGHYLEYDIKSKDIKEIKYWDVKDFYTQKKSEDNEKVVLEELENILKESFNLRMIADVPVGVFLSGGVDSSLVASMIQKNSKSPIKTFTIGFNEKDYDEAIYAKEIAKHIGSEHTELYCDTDDMLELIKELPFLYDEPFGDSSALPTILVSKLAKEKVSVVLSGDGGDEAFIGYSKYFALNKISNLENQALKKGVLKALTSIISANNIQTINNLLPNKFKQKNIKDKYQKFKNAIQSNNIEEMFINASSYVDNDTLKKVFKDTTIEFDKTAFNLKAKSNISALDKMLLMDYKTFMVDDVLTKVDRASMSVSIEAREPLLDHKIIEFSAQLPNSLKYKNGVGKYLLKEVLYKHVPKELIERPKSGFQIPLESWLRTDLKPLVEKYLSKEKLEKSNIYNVNEIENILKDLYSGKTVNISLIWFILMFEMWKEEWLG